MESALLVEFLRELALMLLQQLRLLIAAVAKLIQTLSEPVIERPISLIGDIAQGIVGVVGVLVQLLRLALRLLANVSGSFCTGLLNELLRVVGRILNQRALLLTGPGEVIGGGIGGCVDPLFGFGAAGINGAEGAVKILPQCVRCLLGIQSCLLTTLQFFCSSLLRLFSLTALLPGLCLFGLCLLTQLVSLLLRGVFGGR
jgi:hypothetical protein